ncbi:hypothetical protein [Staphylococcus phage vB_SepM_ phiIPLA-C1C]|jgi:hypothetical protein|uniref:Uncharacterized protein n=1 Tax=Staphylococcus phage vB_SepM_ phiIPLA-C1C TaxID=1572704 RepID=A0A0D3MVH9_9CAUD|nr:hypothetical protein AVU40_gp109 [Staphylococcus phage phiIPLA-C1C]MDU0946704.1 hypothetical protein [Anaerococcus vaginalis]MDU7109193.1 hypothetical protein [Clostridium perfringens]QLF86912.1 hypothetical protein BESEP4_00178 [Staphylococcus phage vB_SepM_BE04]QLF87303.1 hypothetical protein BESEP6_00149 [Staphylococcus phage vB_SepM_BE06]QLF87400.1 hypothetical protein BESEP7_00052 [Staphylococcus phage vB_SepM_BE07]QLF87684.1 hypothetical protein BESEP8_00136 [Staphylococcus phage vB_
MEKGKKKENLKDKSHLEFNSSKDYSKYIIKNDKLLKTYMHEDVKQYDIDKLPKPSTVNRNKYMR